MNPAIRNAGLGLFAYMCMAASSAMCGTITLNPGSVLRVNFTFNPTGPRDVLALFLVSPGPTQFDGSAVAGLYDSAGLLFGMTSNIAGGFFYKSASSFEPFGAAIDFAPLQAPFSGYFLVTEVGTQGHIDTVFTNAAIGRSESNGSWLSNPTEAQITSFSASVPEPIYSRVTGLVCLLFWKLRRRD